MLALYFLVLFWTRIDGAVVGTRNRCEPIAIPLCQDMPYNLTRSPNFLDHQDQNEAAMKLNEFVPLIEVGCSKHLKFFLCSLFAPMCAEQVDTLIPSCQSICEEVKSRCLPILQKFNFVWPLMLNCSKLPVPEKNALCMEFPNITETRHRLKPFQEPNQIPYVPTKITYSPRKTPAEKRCPPTFTPVLAKSLNSYNCVPKCGHDVKYTAEHKVFTSLWMGVFSSVSFMATLLTVLTFCIDAARFRFPEKPIVFLNICLFFCSLAYIIRVFGGPEFISCKNSENGEDYLTHEGLESSGCIVVFLLLYYFGIAALAWWVILAVTWYLAAGKQWSHEAIDARASYFHFLAWGLPSGLTITVLILRYVDADELTGMCFIGNHDSYALLSFVIIPMFILIILGIIFMIVGFVSLLKIKRFMKCEGANVQKFEKLIVRIGFFNCLFAFLSLCWLICYIYEYLMMDRWEVLAIERANQCTSERNCKPEESIADHKLQLIKIALFLVLGISSGAWIWGNKTWASWSVFCRSFCKTNSRRSNKTFSSYAPAPLLIHPGSLKHKRSKSLNFETRV